MQIILTVNSAWNVVNFRRGLVMSLLRSGHSVTVLAPPDKSVDEIKAMGCRFHPLKMSAKGLNPFEGVRMVYSFWTIFRREKPDVVLSYTIKNNLFAAFAARLCRFPFVPNVTGLGTAFLSSKLLRRVAEVLYRHAFYQLPVVFFQNDDDRQLFLDRNLLQIEQGRVLPGSGIDLVRFNAVDYPKENDPPVFLLIARLLRDKGILEYVEAARKVRVQHPKAQFRLLGAIGSQNRTAIDRETVDSWIAEGVIDYRGTTTDVRVEIAQAHCVVLPSYREGAPRTLIEAAAMARPLIATDVPGCCAVVDHGTTGLLCRVRDPDSLADACLEFIGLSHESKRAMGQSGRAKMSDEYDQALVISAYYTAIADVTKRTTTL